MTKDGTEIITIIVVEITLSCHLFFFNAAIIPKTKPSGTEMSIAKTLIKIDGLILSKMIAIALLPGEIAELTPQFHLVKIPVNHAKYC